MRLTGGAGDLLRRLTDMPFLDRLELVAISGWSRDTVYRGLRRLEDAGLVAPVPHGTDLIAPTRRFYVTAAGLRALAREEDLPVENLLRALPASLQWRRLLLQRLDAVAAIYRLASTVAVVAHPLGLRWYRALPMDATLILPGGCTVAVVRQGPSSDRTPFSKRLWRLREGRGPPASSSSCPTRCACATPAACCRAFPRPFSSPWRRMRCAQARMTRSGGCRPPVPPSACARSSIG